MFLRKFFECLSLLWNSPSLCVFKWFLCCSSLPFFRFLSLSEHFLWASWLLLPLASPSCSDFSFLQSLPAGSPSEPYPTFCSLLAKHGPSSIRMTQVLLQCHQGHSLSLVVGVRDSRVVAEPPLWAALGSTALWHREITKRLQWAWQAWVSAPGLGICPPVPKVQLLPGDGEVQGERCQCCCGGGGEEGGVQIGKPGGDIQIPEPKGSEGSLLEGAWELHLVMWEKCTSLQPQYSWGWSSAGLLQCIRLRKIARYMFSFFPPFYFFLFLSFFLFFFLFFLLENLVSRLLSSFNNFFSQLPLHTSQQPYTLSAAWFNWFSWRPHYYPCVHNSFPWGMSICTLNH